MIYILYFLHSYVGSRASSRSYSIVSKASERKEADIKATFLKDLHIGGFKRLHETNRGMNFLYNNLFTQREELF